MFRKNRRDSKSGTEGYSGKAIPFALVAITLFLLIYPSCGHACTVWGASGSRVKGGGTMVAKTRDSAPNLSTALRLLFPKEGYRTLALFDREADGFIVGGINERGLVVLNAAAGSVSEKKRLVATNDVTEYLLTSFDSVNGVLSHPDLFSRSHPALYMIADSSKIAAVEVAPRGNVATTITENGIHAFTNHFTAPKLLGANEKISTSSKARLNRILRLMAEHSSPMTLKDFVAMTEDRAGGPDHGIWRTGSRSDKVRTLASTAIFLPVNGPPEIYIKLSDTGESERVYRVTLDTLLTPTAPE